MHKMTKKNIFIDTNVLAHWLIGKGGLFEYFKKEFKLSDEFETAYITRYNTSIEN